MMEDNHNIFYLKISYDEDEVGLSSQTKLTRSYQFKD